MSNSPNSEKPDRGSSQQQQQQGTQFQRQRQESAVTSLSAKFKFLGGYLQTSDSFDEQIDGQGGLREHWQRLNQFFDKVGPEGLQRREKQIRRLIHQNGIAFSSYGDAEVRARHLQLDPVPHLIPAKQWRSVVAALQQRATLLNAMLEDLYGPKTLLQSGVIPQEALFRHPHFHTPYHDLPRVGKRHLHFYAAELFHSPDGNWWVQADRTDSPGGWGFALENRLAVSRAFPSEFRRNNVQRLAPFFIAMRNQLARFAPNGQANPHIAILSAGTGSKSYFEDSYLARYLGFTLVEANDLVVRSSKVMLKTLAGLTPIDVIVRRQQGNQIDPLECGGSSAGISGLLQVAREGNVTILSTPGSGLVESPIFMAFMPQVCQAILGTDLLVPGVATWWAGQKRSRELILDRIDELELLPAFRQRTILGVQSIEAKLIDPQTLSRQERIEMIRKNPFDWVGQEKINRSSAAVWKDGQLHAGFISMRSYLVADGDDWHAMPGGLVRVSDTPNERILNPFEGGGTKDAWVLDEQPVEPISLLTGSDPVHGEALTTTRSGGHLSSRMADNLCWLGRYFERSDAAARLLRSVVSRLSGENDPAQLVEFPVLIRALAAEGRIDAGFAIKEILPNMPDLSRCLSGFTLDGSDPNSLRTQIDLIVSQAARVRERLSSDVWRTVQKISTNFQSENPEDCEPAELLELTNNLVLDLASFSGLVSESMTRNYSLGFLNIGRRLEHALQIVSLLKCTLLHNEKTSAELLEAVLQISDSVMTYRGRYYANLQATAVLDLLLVDESNPRSLAFQLVELNRSLESLPGSCLSGYTPVQRLAMDTLHQLRMVDIVKLSSSFAEGDVKPLEELLQLVEDRLPKVHDAVSNRFLIHSGPVHQLVTDPFGKPQHG